MLIDYNNGLVNLACSILKEFGCEYNHQTLKCMDELLEIKYKNIVIILLDGMGMDSINYHLDDNSFFRKHLLCDISSVFPPTTTSATTSLESGLTPCEHGWLGWSLYFSEIDKIVNAFINTYKDTQKIAADYHVANRYIPYKSVYEKINEANKGKAFSISKFGTNRINTIDELTSEVERLCAEDGRKYIYAYWENPDSLMHEFGCYDTVVSKNIKHLENKIEILSKKISETLLIVTADHGHINLKYYTLTDYPKIIEMLKRPTSIETRATAFYIKDEYKDKFPDEFRKTFGNDFILYSIEDIKQNKIFGGGNPHVKFDEFIGDFLAVATADMGIVYSRDSKRFTSNHAGLTKKEMIIPFIAISRL